MKVKAIRVTASTDRYRCYCCRQAYEGTVIYAIGMRGGKYRVCGHCAEILARRAGTKVRLPERQRQVRLPEKQEGGAMKSRGRAKGERGEFIIGVMMIALVMGLFLGVARFMNRDDGFRDIAEYRYIIRNPEYIVKGLGRWCTVVPAKRSKNCSVLQEVRVYDFAGLMHVFGDAVRSRSNFCFSYICEDIQEFREAISKLPWESSVACGDEFKQWHDMECRCRVGVPKPDSETERTGVIIAGRAYRVRCSCSVNYVDCNREEIIW